jgi:hypothetical protein
MVGDGDGVSVTGNGVQVGRRVEVVVGVGDGVGVCVTVGVGVKVIVGVGVAVDKKDRLAAMADPRPVWAKTITPTRQKIRSSAAPLASTQGNRLADRLATGLGSFCESGWGGVALTEGTVRNGWGGGAVNLWSVFRAPWLSGLISSALCRQYFFCSTWSTQKWSQSQAFSSLGLAWIISRNNGIAACLFPLLINCTAWLSFSTFTNPPKFLQQIQNFLSGQ